MTANPNDSLSALRRVDPLVMASATVTLFLGLASEAWWTLTGATSRSLLNIRVSPFFLQILATGFPSTVPYADVLGGITRVVVFVGAVSLFAAGYRPTAWWRNIAVYVGLSSILELYLSFALMYYWAQTAFIGAYGVVPPYYGTQKLSTNVIGLDLRYYATPLVTASFAFPYYLGYLGLALVLGRSIIKIVQERAMRVLVALLPGGGVHDVYITPPYKHVWFSSGDQQFNPMLTDPEKLNDDELLVSFQRLYETVEPGGSLSILLPQSAVSTVDRFQKLMPNTGFIVESVATVSRTSGKPEHELRFRKPAQATETAQAVEIAEPSPVEGEVREPVAETTTPEIEAPPVVESSEEPIWSKARMTHAERVMLKSAIGLISERNEPVPYRELINHVYMDMIDKRIDFDSARQIENTLTSHQGRELLLIEEPDVKTGSISRKWWLGEQKMTDDPKQLPLLKILPAGGLNVRKPKLPRPRNMVKRFRKPKYKKRKEDEEDPARDSAYYDASSESPVY